jgi:isoquinoline 1-oxidoreductase alpha subunit
MARPSLTVNGTRRTFDGDQTMPLLWFLRDELSLTGTKYGCGISQCGACTVHVNGAPARSCQRRMSTLNGAAVTTIEGLHSSGEHPLQVAWREIDVPQCGFCQSGQIMQAANLLTSNPAPSDQDIDSAMTGHICRWDLSTYSCRHQGGGGEQSWRRDPSVAATRPLTGARQCPARSLKEPRAATPRVAIGAT